MWLLNIQFRKYTIKYYNQTKYHHYFKKNNCTVTTILCVFPNISVTLVLDMSWNTISEIGGHIDLYINKNMSFCQKYSVIVCILI